MNVETEKIITDIKEVISSLNVIITGNTGIILIDNKLIYSTQGDVTDQLIQSYLSGLHRGILSGMKYQNNQKIK